MMVDTRQSVAEVNIRTDVGTSCGEPGRLMLDGCELILVGVSHWHPACAIRTLRALHALQDDSHSTLIAVELPEGIERSVVDALTQLYPTRWACALTLSFEQEAVDSPQQAIVLSAADAITQATMFAIRREHPWACIDLCEPGVSRSAKNDSRWPDPWAGVEMPTEYATLLFECSSRLKSCDLDRRREEHMAAVLREKARTVRRIVAVVGAAHLHPIRSFLTEASRPRRQLTTRRQAPPQLACVDPRSVITRHLGPVPVLGLRVERLARDPHALAAVDPAAEVEELVHGAIEDYRKLREQATRIGQVRRFYRAAWKSVVRDGRVMGGLQDLHRAACAAVDDDFGLLISRRCCGELVLTTTPSEFPVIRTGDDEDDTDEIALPDGRCIPIIVRGSTNIPWATGGPFDELDGHRGWISSFFDRRASRSGGQTSDTTWRNWMQATTRLRALTQCSTERVGKKWQGGSVRRVDVGRTIRARLRGERSTLWIQAEQPNRAASPNELEDFEPICWVFEPSSLGSCTSYFTRGGQNRTYVTSHVYTTGLFPGRGPTGGWVQYLGGRLVLAPAATLRYSETSRALFRKWLHDSGRSVPNASVWASDRCIREMLNTSERQRYDKCELHERLLLGAICYARRYVIHARYEALRADALFHRIARRRGVRIIEVDLSALGTELVERIRRFEFV